MLLRQLYTSSLGGFRPLGWLSLLRRPQSARQVSKMKRIEWSNVPSGQHLGPPFGGLPKVVRESTFSPFVEHFFSNCRAPFSPEVRP